MFDNAIFILEQIFFCSGRRFFYFGIFGVFGNYAKSFHCSAKHFFCLFRKIFVAIYHIATRCQNPADKIEPGVCRCTGPSIRPCQICGQFIELRRLIIGIPTHDEQNHQDDPKPQCNFRPNF